MAANIDNRIEGNQLVISLSGRIDSSNAAEVSGQILSAIQAHPDLSWILDADRLDYVSSAGLRIFLSLSKKSPSRVILRNVSSLIYETLSITGFTEILDVKKQLRSISVDGCPEIGRGAIGTVYRLDADTIVKVYQIPDCLPMIENEQKRAKQAFIRGIPTAISYDIVRVGDKYGSVFEMVKAENCNDRLIKDPDHKDDIIQQYVKLVKAVHAVEMKPGELPDAREIYNGYLDDIAGIMPKDMVRRLLSLLEAMPEDLHTVHGDIQMKNVMLSESEPLFIDMESLCTGNPVFDFAGLWVAYCAFNLEEPTNSMDFFGVDSETSFGIYHKVLALYLGDVSDDKLRQAEERIMVLGYIRFLYLLSVLHLGKPELMDIRIRHALDSLEQLLQRVDQLCI
ncbi:MAG: phosphotransferase [Clostridia bacterium]|nr:phosphotransferase [Clostridia bacterium]